MRERQAQTADERDAIQQRRRERRATETAEQRYVGKVIERP